MKIWQKIVLGFGAALLMLALLAFVTYHSTRRLLHTTELVAQSRHVLEIQESFLRNLVGAENSVRGYLLMADEQYLPDYERAQQNLIADFNELKVLTREHQDQQARLEEIRPLISQKFAILRAAMTARRSTGAEEAARLLGDGENKKTSEELTRLLADFENVEQQFLLRSSALMTDIGHSTTLIIAFATALSALLLGLAASFILRDVAARRRAEEALAEERNLLSNVIDAMPDNVFVKDLRGRYVLDNVAHRNFLGAAHLRDIEGKTARDFFPRDIAQQFEEGDAQVLKEGLRDFSRDEPVIDRRGALIWLSTRKVTLCDIDGNCIGLVGVSGDISERKEAENALHVTTEQLKRSNYELQEFASVASHDLQEPLRKIQAFGDRLMRKCGEAVGEEGRDYLERMQNAAKRMQTLLHDLLTLSRVTSQARPFEPVSLESIVREVLGDLELRIEQTGAQVEVGYLPTIDADSAQMRQLLQNLISNALKFQSPGTVPEIFISAKIRELVEQQLPGVAVGEEVCQLMVQDNGIGFDEKYLDRIFTVFQRLHSRSEYEGTGIGLAVCRKILVRHGGMISARSAEGQGATFIVTLPLKQRMKSSNEDSRQPDHDFNGG